MDAVHLACFLLGACFALGPTVPAIWVLSAECRRLRLLADSLRRDRPGRDPEAVADWLGRDELEGGE